MEVFIGMSSRLSGCNCQQIPSQPKSSNKDNIVNAEVCIDVEVCRRGMMQQRVWPLKYGHCHDQTCCGTAHIQFPSIEVDADVGIFKTKLAVAHPYTVSKH